MGINTIDRLIARLVRAPNQEEETVEYVFDYVCLCKLRDALEDLVTIIGRKVK
jgi:hypothetical protein